MATVRPCGSNAFPPSCSQGQAQLCASVPAAMPMRKPAASATMAVSQPDEDQVQPLLLWDIWLHCKNPQRPCTSWVFTRKVAKSATCQLCGHPWRDSLRQGGAMLHDRRPRPRLQPRSQLEGQWPDQQGQGPAQEGHVQGQGEGQEVMAPEWPDQAEVFLSKKEKIQDVLPEPSGCAAHFAARVLGACWLFFHALRAHVAVMLCSCHGFRAHVADMFFLHGFRAQWLYHIQSCMAISFQS